MSETFKIAAPAAVDDGAIMTSLTIAANALGGPAATAPRMTTAPVFRPGDRGYDAERAVFNLAVDHRPRLVVGARGPADVVAAVRLAGASGLAIGVLATGHGAAAAAADGALLINTRRMNRVEVDPVGRTATIGAGARWERVLAETVPHGLAPLNGSSPHVGAIGYTLGGGIGLLGRRYGYAADLVQELEVVTADGVLRRVSADRDPDLFWALRGGKGNFGVVVSMRIELVPVARLFGGGLYFAADAAADLLHTYRQWTSTVPEEMASSVMLAEFPHDPALPEPLRGRFVAHLRIAYSGSAEEGERLVRPLRALGRPLLDTLTEMPYGEVGSIHHDSTVPEAAYDRSLLLRELDAAATNVILSRATPEAQPPLVVELRHHGGAYARPPRVPNAVGGRDAAFTLFSGSAMEPGHLAEVRRSHDELHELLRPWSTGGAVLNFMGTDDLSPARVRAAFTARDYRRLTEIKATYDPENVFRVNHNIPPAGRGSSRSVGTSASDRRTQPPAIRT